MKPFYRVAVPHKDILEGRLTMDVFAADLWEVYKERAPPEYIDAELFFKKTYITEGLKNLLDIVEKRLKGDGGDPVIQIQTPFGGGKTHALIALYHKARQQWGAKPVVIVGTALDPKNETLWGLLGEQLGVEEEDILTRKISPGRETLRSLLEKHQPILILIDEVLEYVTKAAGVPVGETTLAAQTIAFMQELTEVAGTLERVCVVMTLPSSFLEHYDMRVEELFHQLQKVSGRVERVYTPVQENEISRVIRRRLFSLVNESEVRHIISEFMEYAEREGILPAGVDPRDYMSRFIESYPFLPEVIDVLYHRWGSIPTFQRTRGVLRILSLVIHSLKGSSNPYITLSDFDLANQEIRWELIKHIGSELDSIIAADITGPDSGSKKVDSSIGSVFQGLRIGTRTATCIFLYSFSGAEEKGATINEIKRSATVVDNPSSIVVEAIDHLKNKLFYLHHQNGKYYFTKQPNLVKILLSRMENIKDDEVRETEREMLKAELSGKKFKVFIWPDKTKDIPDTPDLKLIVIPQNDVEFMKDMLESKGDSPRVYRNTILFLCPSDIEKNSLLNSIKRKIAYEWIKTDKTLKLTEEQNKDVDKYLDDEKKKLKDIVKSCYRLVYLPKKDEKGGLDLEVIDLGIPTFGVEEKLDEWVYSRLRDEEKIFEKISPLVIRDRYLREKDFVGVKLIYESMLRTPGERRPISRTPFDESIIEGVKNGMFGLGYLVKEGERPICKYFKTDAEVTFSEYEVIINDTICIEQQQEKVRGPSYQQPPTQSQSSTETPTPLFAFPSPEESISQPSSSVLTNSRDSISLEFNVPRGKLSDIMRMMNFIHGKFEELRITIRATKGSISDAEYKNKIIETLRQLGIKVNE